MVTFAGRITVRNIADGKELYRFAPNGAINSIVYSPDGKYIIAGTRQGIDVWDASKGQKIRTIGGFSGGVTSIAHTVTGSQKTVEFQLPPSLDPRPNRIEVVAFNGYSESRRYADSNIRNLNYCVADAKSVVDSLKVQEGKRYGRVNSLLIADGEGLSPTAANIRQNLGFLEGAGPRDVALLFLAGHGVSGSAGAFFFLPTDTRLNADSTVNPATAVTGAELFAALDAPGIRGGKRRICPVYRQPIRGAVYHLRADESAGQ
jgi:hypothetical protein